MLLAVVIIWWQRLSLVLCVFIMWVVLIKVFLLLMIKNNHNTINSKNIFINTTHIMNTHNTTDNRCHHMMTTANNIQNNNNINYVCLFFLFVGRYKCSINDTSCTPRVAPQVERYRRFRVRWPGDYSGHSTKSGGNLSAKMAFKEAFPCTPGGTQRLPIKRIWLVALHPHLAQ
jgi:hypothetical protein